MDTFELPEEYQIRTDLIPHDDRGLKDEWQDEVYSQSRIIAARLGAFRIMDYGCGSGFKLVKYFDDFNTVGIEKYPCLSFLHSEYPDKVWHRYSPPKQFDLIICADVVEHMCHPDDLIQLFLMYDCPIVISTPDRDLVIGNPPFGPPMNTGHVREWGFKEFENFIGRYAIIKEHEHCSDHPECQWILAIP